MASFIRFLAFSLGRAVQGIRRNRLMSFAAVATMLLMLLLLAVFWVLQAGLAATVTYVEQKVEIVAEMRDASGAEPALTVESVALAREIAAQPVVASVTFVSKDVALAEFRQRLLARGQVDLTGSLDRNPLPASLEVKLVDPHNFGSVVTTLKDRTQVVADVVEVEDLVSRLTTVTDVLRTGGVVVLFLVGLVVLFIIVNTIRLAVVARREEIEIMRLVGASGAFIRWPFIFEGGLVGLIAALAALGLIALVSDPVTHFMAAFFQVLPLELGAVSRDLFVVILATGVGLGVLGSWLSVRSYLGR